MEVTVDPESDSKEKKPCCRRIPWGKIGSHLGLYAITTAYLFLGGLIFHLVESPHEQDIENEVSNDRENFLQNLLNVSSDNWTDTARKLLLDYETELQYAWKQGWRTQVESKWGYFSACFFCLTVVSTIGYGHITPITQSGRLAAIIYAILGIPLFFMFLARAGHLVAIPLRKINSMIMKSCTSCPDCDCNGGADSVSRFGSTMSFFAHNMNEDVMNCESPDKQEELEDGSSTKEAKLPGIPEYDDISCKVEALDDEESLFSEVRQKTIGTQTDDILWQREANKIQNNTAENMNSSIKEIKTSQGTLVIPSKKEMNGDTRQRAITETLTMTKPIERRVEVPISILLMLQITYLLGGAALLNVSQGHWTFLDCVYFSTITFTTVGFGDLIPNYENSANNILKTTTFISIYIVIGLILMSSCISLSQQRILRFIRMGMRGCSKKCSCCRGCCS
ncbi:potassium channel subfamily K member 18-like [Ptychodera flava]|uniref:potassium channel subfamily K member 18-like n=1 Tax=Ptychodera flava TaxID=63121 RepID=UPI00396A8561